jgi:hypothetical protein
MKTSEYNSEQAVTKSPSWNQHLDHLQVLEITGSLCGGDLGTENRSVIFLGVLDY